MPGSFTTATPLVLRQSETKPLSTKSNTPTEVSLDTDIVELIKSTCEDLLDDQCTLRNICLELQDQQRNLQGFLSALFGETSMCKTRIEDLHAKIQANQERSEVQTKIILEADRLIDEVIIQNNKNTVENHNLVWDMLKRQENACKNIYKEISA